MASHRGHDKPPVPARTIKRFSLAVSMLLAATARVSYSETAPAQAGALVYLQITSAQSVFHAPVDVPIAVCITNCSTNVVGVALPVCYLQDYEVWLTGTSGRSTNIVAKPTNTGPSVFRGTGFWELHASQSVACTLNIPLRSSIESGKYRVVVKRWCVIFLDWGPDGKVVSSARKQIISNPIDIEVN